jgi:hypothetical protein
VQRLSFDAKKFFRIHSFVLLNDCVFVQQLVMNILVIAVFFFFQLPMTQANKMSCNYFFQVDVSKNDANKHITEHQQNCSMEHNYCASALTAAVSKNDYRSQYFADGFCVSKEICMNYYGVNGDECVYGGDAAATTLGKETAKNSFSLVNFALVASCCCSSENCNSVQALCASAEGKGKE